MAIRDTQQFWQRRGSSLDTAPAIEPVTASDLRSFLRTNATDLPDSEANDFIAEARQLIEETYNVALITQTWLLALDRWPTRGREPWWDGVVQASIRILDQSYGDLSLPKWPLQAVDGVNVYDEAGAATAVVVADTFDVDTYRVPGRMTLKAGSTWPVALRANNAIEITYTVGYGAAAADVPAPLKRAVKQLAAYLYSHRGDGCEAGMALEDSGAAALVGKYKVIEI